MARTWRSQKRNALTTLPDSLGDLTSLAYLDLRSNALTEPPASLADLPNLEKLDLRWCKHLVMPGWLSDLEARGCVVYC